MLFKAFLNQLLPPVIVSYALDSATTGASAPPEAAIKAIRLRVFDKGFSSLSTVWFLTFWYFSISDALSVNVPSIYIPCSVETLASSQDVPFSSAASRATTMAFFLFLTFVSSAASYSASSRASSSSISCSEGPTGVGPTVAGAISFEGALIIASASAAGIKPLGTFVPGG